MGAKCLPNVLAPKHPAQELFGLMQIASINKIFLNEMLKSSEWGASTRVQSRCLFGSGTDKTAVTTLLTLVG